MKIQQLLQIWDECASEKRASREYRLKLPVNDAAKVAALAEMYPGRSEEQIVTDLIAAALDELEARLPYIPGTTIAAEDERGDPIYEDIGPTPRFKALTKKYLRGG